MDMNDLDFCNKMAELLPDASFEALKALAQYAKELDEDGLHPKEDFFKESYAEYYLVKRHYGVDTALQLLNVANKHSFNSFEIRGAANLLKDGMGLNEVCQYSIDNGCDRSNAEMRESVDTMRELEKSGAFESPVYTLAPFGPEESKLFFSLSDKTANERHGTIGHLRGDFDTGQLFYCTWFDCQKHLKGSGFKAELDHVVAYLRGSLESPVLKSRADMAAYCYKHPDQSVKGAWHQDIRGFKIASERFSYYVKCFPHKGDYNFYIHCYDNRYLLPELEGKHELPSNCFSILPSSGELIFLVMGENVHIPTGLSTSDPALNRQIAAANNALLGVTRAQEEAMLAGSLFGWDPPAAKPWNYEQDGSPRQQPQQPKRDEPER